MNESDDDDIVEKSDGNPSNGLGSSYVSEPTHATPSKTSPEARVERLAAKNQDESSNTSPEGQQSQQTIKPHPKKETSLAKTKRLAAQKKKDVGELTKPMPKRTLPVKHGSSASSEVDELEKERLRAEKRRRRLSSSLGGIMKEEGESSKSQRTMVDENIEKYSRFRLCERKIPREEMDNIMDTYKYISMQRLSSYSQRKLTEFSETTQWATIAIVSEKSLTKASSNGKKYLILTLTDFSKRITMFLFDEAYETHRKSRNGTVVLVCDPRVIPASNDSKSFSLGASSASTIVPVGTATDFGQCKGVCKSGNRCTMPVNLKKTSFCEFHIVSEFKKLGTRGGFNTANSAGLVKPNFTQGKRNISAGSYSSRSFQKVDGAEIYFAPNHQNNLGRNQNNPKAIRDKAMRNQGITTGACKMTGSTPTFRGAYGYQPNSENTRKAFIPSSSRKPVLKVGQDGSTELTSHATDSNQEKRKHNAEVGQNLGKAIEDASKGGGEAHQVSRGGIHFSKAVGYKPVTKGELHKQSLSRFEGQKQAGNQKDPLGEALGLRKYHNTDTAPLTNNQKATEKRRILESSVKEIESEYRSARSSSFALVDDSRYPLQQRRLNVGQKASNRAGAMAGIHNRISPSSHCQHEAMTRYSSKVTSENVRIRGLYGNEGKSPVQSARERLKEKNIEKATKNLSASKAPPPVADRQKKNEAVQKALQLHSSHEKEVVEDDQEIALSKMDKQESIEEMRRQVAEKCGTSMKVTVWQCLEVSFRIASLIMLLNKRHNSPTIIALAV